MLIDITKEQLSRLEMFSSIGDYYIDAMEPSNSMYEQDKETVTQGKEVIEEINNQFSLMRQMEQQERIRLGFIKAYNEELNNGL